MKYYILFQNNVISFSSSENEMATYEHVQFNLSYCGEWVLVQL
jgi:phosphopantetheinyl transferase